MFFSLNKKFIYTIAIFFIFTAVLFVYTFYIVYGSKIQEEQKSTILRNQQYLELLYENINLRKDLSRLIRAGHEDLFSKENLNVIRGNNNLEEKQPNSAANSSVRPRLSRTTTNAIRQLPKVSVWLWPVRF